MPTTPVAVVDEVLRPVIAAGSIYRCARILNIFAPSPFGDTFSKSATKTTKRATTRDCVDRIIPGVFDVADDTHGRDGCSIVACHRRLLDIRMRLYPQESRSLLKVPG